MPFSNRASLNLEFHRRVQIVLFLYFINTYNFISGWLPRFDGKPLPGEYRCPKCGRIYQSMGGMWNHKKYECGVEPKHICQFCDYRSHYAGNFRRHVRQKHSRDIIL